MDSFCVQVQRHQSLKDVGICHRSISFRSWRCRLSQTENPSIPASQCKWEPKQMPGEYHNSRGVYMMVPAKGLLPFSHLWFEDSLVGRNFYTFKNPQQISILWAFVLELVYYFCFHNILRKEFHSFTAHGVTRHLLLSVLSLASNSFIWRLLVSNCIGWDREQLIPLHHPLVNRDMMDFCKITAGSVLFT